MIEWLNSAAFGAPITWAEVLGFVTGLVNVGLLVRRIRRPDLYLLTDDAEVPFADDGLRDGETIRQWMTGRFRDALQASGVRRELLTGTYAQRLRAAVAATDALLAEGWTFTAPLSETGTRPIGG